MSMYFGRAVLLSLAGLLSACTSAGPFVTNISNTGENKILVEKCEIEANSFTHTISNKNCTSYTVTLGK